MVWTRKLVKFFIALFVIALLSAIEGLPGIPGVGFPPALAETTGEAINRIRQGAHAAMPPPSSVPATGPMGKGMTIENRTGHRLDVHFSGPVSRTVRVADGDEAGVDLGVGHYQVAAELPGSQIMPFYGEQTYEPNTHYWLQFYVQERW